MSRTRKLILTLVLPLTIILFGTLTKWRYVTVEDGPDDFIHGFPLPFICSGWHTSMSFQIFVIPFVFNFIVYFLFCLIVILFIDRFIKSLVVNKYFKVLLYVMATLYLLLYGFIFSNPDNLFKLHRDFNYQEIRSGYKFVWQQNKR